MIPSDKNSVDNRIISTMNINERCSGTNPKFLKIKLYFVRTTIMSLMLIKRIVFFFFFK